MPYRKPPQVEDIERNESKKLRVQHGRYYKNNTN